MSKKQINIDNYEKDILEDLEKGALKTSKNAEEEKRFAKEAAKNYLKRDSRINIRISKADLNMIRKIAVEEGLPYQTLLASIIHKFATGRMYDRGRNDEAA